MNKKMNFFVSKNRTYDLEYNIPLQTSNNTKFTMDFESKNKCAYYQQVKIYSDSSRSLNFNRASKMHFPVTRIDLMYWLHVTSLEDNIEIIKNASLYRLNKIYNDCSLLHYFADKSEILLTINQQFKEALESKTILSSERKMPLMILNRDNEGKTALDRALEKKKPKSFE